MMWGCSQEQEQAVTIGYLYATEARDATAADLHGAPAAALRGAIVAPQQATSAALLALVSYFLLDTRKVGSRT